MSCILDSKCFGKWMKEQFYLNNNNNISIMKTTYLLIKLKISCLSFYHLFFTHFKITWHTFPIDTR